MSIFSTLKARRTCTRVFGGNCVLHQKLHKVAMVKFFPEGACNYNALTQTFFGIQDKSVDLHLIFEISSSRNWFLNLIFCLFQTGFLQAKQAVKIKFELDKKSSSKINFMN